MFSRYKEVSWIRPTMAGRQWVMWQIWGALQLPRSAFKSPKQERVRSDMWTHTSHHALRENTSIPAGRATKNIYTLKQWRYLEMWESKVRHLDSFTGLLPPPVTPITFWEMLIWTKLLPRQPLQGSEAGGWKGRSQACANSSHRQVLLIH